ncbi:MULTISPECIES: hypothetical protein [Streptomyces]|uniref:Hydrogenase maturation protease n=1 Tax=Streptomyces griseocarneus TaxID=51201 RepID=A0ABX7RQX3_9ACTN|nr:MULTISPECIES: hypothetical protein [Streptomyces]QSY49784.1 hypothetical protein J3S04_01285 [Streptomyces griseocarneus]
MSGAMGAAGVGEDVGEGVDEAVEKIARTCLYEGYLLWPYRRSALKNTRRWTFGGVFPQTRARSCGERDMVRAEVLLEAADEARLTVRVRFLHVLERQVHRVRADGGREPVDSLTVAGRRHLTWQEATEHEWVLPPWSPADGPLHTEVHAPAVTDEEPLPGDEGRPAGFLVRTRRPLSGTVTLEAVPVADGVRRIGVAVRNTTPCPEPGGDPRTARDELAPYALVSTHLVLGCESPGAFVSLADPPAALREAAGACRNDGTWPALVAGYDGPRGGDRQRSRAVLASPVTLEDFPAVAPESPGDLFDGGEIDQLLILNVLALTPHEREEARASDPRAREILDRCAALSPDDLMALHGTIRGFAPAVRSLEEER